MLLGLYLGTTAFVWYDTFKSMYDNRKRLEKEGYKIEKRKVGTLGNIIVWGIFMVLLSIPAANLLFPLSNFNKEKSYDTYKNMMLEAGHIEELDNKPNDIKDNVKETVNQKEKVVSNSKVYYRPVFREETDIDEKGYTYRKILK